MSGLQPPRQPVHKIRTQVPEAPRTDLDGGRRRQVHFRRMPDHRSELQKTGRHRFGKQQCSVGHRIPVLPTTFSTSRF
jgi:hypothetical protein